MNYDSEGTIPPVWNIGDVILGLYEVKQVFKSGGMGLVYRVHHREWNMDLAVKSPRPELLRGLANLDQFVRECETWVIRYQNQPFRDVNYEDLAYMAGQIHDDFLENYENPAITPFVNDALSILWHPFPENQRPPAEQLADLAGDATDYIHDIVRLMLDKPATETNHLSLFLDAARDAKVQELNLFTLNHDSVL
jgi:hypothetical protein